MTAEYVKELVASHPAIAEVGSSAQEWTVRPG